MVSTIYSFIASFRARTKRIYFNSCSNIILFARVCNQVCCRIKLVEIIVGFGPFLKKLILQNCFNLSVLFQATNSIMAKQKKIRDIAKSYSKKFPSSNPILLLSNDLELIAIILQRCNELNPSSENIQHVYLKHFQNEGFATHHTQDCIDLLNKTTKSEAFVRAAIDNKVENVRDILRLIRVFMILSRNCNFNYSAVSLLLKTYCSTESVEQCIYAFTYACRQIDCLQLFEIFENPSSIPTSIFGQFLDLILLAKDNLINHLKLSDTKIFTSSQCYAQSMMCQKDQHIINDPATCEYIREALLEPSSDGIDLKKVSDHIQLIDAYLMTEDQKTTIQIPQYFQTNDLTNDSLLDILLKKNICAKAESCIIASGYERIDFDSYLHTFIFPSNVFAGSTKRTEFNSERLTMSCRLPKMNGLSAQVTPTVPLNDFMESMYCDNEFICGEGLEIFEEIEFDELTSSESFENDVFTYEYNDSSSESIDFEEEEDDDPWYDPKFLHFDEEMPTIEDGPFDIRYLKVGPNLKCGLRNFELFHPRNNHYWLIIYNTIRLFFYYLEKDYGIDCDIESSKIFTLKKVPKGDVAFLKGSALEVFAFNGFLNFDCEYNNLFYRALNKVFEENEDRIEEMKAAHDKAVESAKNFVDKNFDKVMDPLVNWAHAQSSPAQMAVCSLARRDRILKRKEKRK